MAFSGSNMDLAAYCDRKKETVATGGYLRTELQYTKQALVHRIPQAPTILRFLTTSPGQRCRLLHSPTLSFGSACFGICFSHPAASVLACHGAAKSRETGSHSVCPTAPHARSLCHAILHAGSVVCYHQSIIIENTHSWVYLLIVLLL